jgi:hypothetical protein
MEESRLVISGERGDPKAFLEKNVIASPAQLP